MSKIVDKAEVIKSEAQELVSKLIDGFELEVSEDQEVFHVVIKASEADTPTVIGRHGETIKAIQKLLEVILYKKFGEATELLVNVNDYREKQRERLEELAERYVQKTKDLNEPSYIKGLSSYERKLIHEYVSERYPELTSYSTGEGKERRLVIEPKGGDARGPKEEEGS